jgi:hypothetical protein
MNLLFETAQQLVAENHRVIDDLRGQLAARDATIATLREAILRPKDKTPASRQLVNLSEGLRVDAEEDAAELQMALKDLLRVAEATGPFGHPAIAKARALIAKIEG